MVSVPEAVPGPAARAGRAKRSDSDNAIRMNDFSFSNQAAVAELALHERVDDRAHHYAGDAERSLADEDRHQDLPRLRVGLAADDARVHQVFELVDEDEKNERGHGGRERDAHRQDDDDGVRDEVAEDRDQAADEGDEDDRRGEGETAAEERQDA